MKNIFLILTIISLGISNIEAQSPTLPLEDWDDEISGAYYKDLDNELDTFVGTWLYTNGNTSWKMELKKEEMFFNGRYYHDLIGSEYQYIKNGIEVINTLSNLNTVEGWGHRIDGNDIYKDCNYLPPSNCIDGESRLILTLSDPLIGHAARVYINQTVKIKHFNLYVKN